MIDDDSDEESEGLDLLSAGLGFVQGSSFQLVCNDTLSHSPSSSASTSSFPFTRNHHRLRPEISLVFLLTESCDGILIFIEDIVKKTISSIKINIPSQIWEVTFGGNGVPYLGRVGIYRVLLYNLYSGARVTDVPYK